MHKLLLSMALLLTFSTAFACPELDNVDLASGDGPWIHKELDTYKISLTKEDFINLPNFDESEYEDCKDAFIVQVVQSKQTGRIFSALKSYEDMCDGGNSYGVLYNAEMSVVVGEIADSGISCY